MYLPLKNRSISSTQYSEFLGFVFWYQIKVVSTLLSGGIGRKPNPGFVPIILSFNSYLGRPSRSDDAKINHIATKNAAKVA